MHAYLYYRQFAGMAAAGLATNCSNAVARTGITNTYSRSYKPRATPLREPKTRDTEERTGYSNSVADSNCENAGKEGPRLGKNGGRESASGRLHTLVY
jgi:hypothetical protein